MFIGTTPPIQPTPPQPVFCAECGSEVSAIAWRCANCGNRLHVSGGITYARPHLSLLVESQCAKQTKARSKVILQILGELATMLFFIFLAWLKWSQFDNRRPIRLVHIPQLGGMDPAILLMMFIFGAPLLYWIWTVVDRLLSIPSKPRITNESR